MDEPPAAVSDAPIQRSETIAEPWHTIVLILILAGVVYAGYSSFQHRAAAANPHRVFFYLTSMAWEWLVFVYICWGVHRHGKSFRNIAGDRWRSIGGFLIDFAIAFGFWTVAIIILSVVSSLLRARGMAEAARTLAPHGILESLLWVCVAVTAGICEETIFRGYLQRQFVAWTRSAVVGVLLSALLFGAAHIYQGKKATIVIAVYGLMFGILAEVRKNLRPGMMVHAWHDAITGLVIRYLPIR